MALTVAVARFDAPTTTGNTDFTTTDLGGLTPSGVLVFSSGADTDNVAEDATHMGIGFTDGTEEATVGCYMRNGNATHESNHFHTDTQTQTLSTNQLFSEANVVSFITNGVRLNFTDAPSSAHFITIVFFAGTDIAEVQVDTFNIANAQNGTASISTMGGTPDIVFCMNQRQTFPAESAPGDGRFSFGVAVNDGSQTQRCTAFYTPRAQSTSLCNATIRNNRFGVCYFNSSVEWTVELTSFDSNGYTVTTRDGTSGGRSISCMAIRLAGDSEAWVGDADPPTSTGSDSITGVGFEPSFVLQGMTMMQTANSNITTGDSGSFGFSTMTTDDQISNAWACEDGASTENAQSLSDNQAVRFTDDAGTETFAATLTSFDSDGWTQNYSAADSTQRLWWGLAIGTATTAITLPADSGSFSYTGTAATLTTARLVDADSGAFSFSGTDATLTASRQVDAESGSFGFTGADATLTVQRTLLAEAGPFSFTGQDATLTLVQADFILDAESGSFGFTGQDANLEIGRLLEAESGSFAWAGQDATLTAARIIDIESGSYGWTGQDASLFLASLLGADVGSFSFTGSDADLRFTAANVFPASPGNYAYTGQSADFFYDRVITAESGAFGFGGRAATLIYSGEVQNVAGRPTEKRKPKRKRRRFILPNGQVFTDPDRALFELRRLLTKEAKAAESGAVVSRSDSDAANIGSVVTAPDTEPKPAKAVSKKSLTPIIMQKVILDLPEMIEARPRQAQPIDPQLISVLFQMIDDEEAAMLLL